ncbi:pentatricopeptide repeat-containing protein At1g10270-like [Etheostoma cragini]|uniref:pentatricopeptide repeat-containing protein At1g10270-like n=1 Tax=Etheostoma cragini TaxID=417921 RepID=UPI00155E8273|nr:pentatricopeptide repeat-containing protein At1g10270-like [Etheostoma cragini]
MTEAMGAVWALVFCALTVWITKGLSLPVGDTNERHDNELQRRAIRDMSLNDIYTKKAFVLLQLMESKLIQAAKEAQLETNEVEAEAALQKREDVQLPLNRLQNLRTGPLSRDQPANVTPVPANNKTYGDTPANQTSGPSANQTSGPSANQTSGPSANHTYGDQPANQTYGGQPDVRSLGQPDTYGDQPANQTSGPWANQTYGDQPANQTSGPWANQTYGDQPANQTSGPSANQTYVDQPANQTLVPLVKLMSVDI